MTIKKYILENSYYRQLADNSRTWKLFKKSDYFSYILEDISEKKDFYKIIENINHYCHEFLQKNKNLNLI